MKITFDYRNATPSHCDVAIFVNGALAGELKLRQDEIAAFQQIVQRGTDPERDSFDSGGQSTLHLGAPERPFNLEPGDVVQLDPEKVRSKAFAGCFMVVTEPKAWGAQGYIQPIGERLGTPGVGQAYYRAQWDEMQPTGGTAVWQVAP